MCSRRALAGSITYQSANPETSNKISSNCVDLLRAVAVGVPIEIGKDVVVVGGETNGYWRIMGSNYSKTVSVDAWESYLEAVT